MFRLHNYVARHIGIATRKWGLRRRLTRRRIHRSNDWCAMQTTTRRTAIGWGIDLPRPFIARRVDGRITQAIDRDVGRFGNRAGHIGVPTKARHAGVPPVVRVAQWKNDAATTNVNTRGFVRRTHATRKRGVPLGLGRKVLANEYVDGPDQIPPRPCHSAVHTIAREYAEHRTTPPFGSPMRRGQTPLRRFGICRLKPYGTTKRQQRAMEFSPVMSLEPRG